MAWKNGGGHTVQIAVEPEGASLSNFTWRVSIAAIERDGPFSAFAGVDRTLVLLAGGGMKLTGDGTAVELRAPFEPVTFSGDVDLYCALVAGPTRDFNLMVRRATARGTLRVVRDQACALPQASTYLCYAAAGACECLLPGFPPIVLHADHTLLVVARPLHVNPTTPQSVALVAEIAAA